MLEINRLPSQGNVGQFVHLSSWLVCRGADPQATTPFSIGCQQLGFQEIGGKLDDIAVSSGCTPLPA